MAVTPQQYKDAALVQNAAAQDINSAIRLVAGPGTGKSFVIEGRIHWLLSNQNVQPKNIIAVSFTRAAARDLKSRIYGFCIKKGQSNVTDVHVSTLHSLALKILKMTGGLNLYPAQPTIMDDWELVKIFDTEFALFIKTTPARADEIRRDHEAFWSTRKWNPPNMPILKTPITQPEREAFRGYFSAITQLYSCVLPGEVIRACVDGINAGLIDPVEILGIEHLIVDEVQDLNFCDFEFIEQLMQRGVKVFISGDDDQSVYSFRYAFPQGIQDFTMKHHGSTNHVLNDCFRCTPAVLTAALNVITSHPAPNRILKNLTSVYASSNPINNGFVQSNAFSDSRKEARYIANSCAALIKAGVSPKEIMILISNKNALVPEIAKALQFADVEFDIKSASGFKDDDHGRFLFALLRLMNNANDYVAHRIVLGTPKGVGSRTCKAIADKVIANNMNYKSIFYTALPVGVFNAREEKAIKKASANIVAVSAWDLSETIGHRITDIDHLLASNFSQTEVDAWRDFAANLPQAMTLDELLRFIQADSQESKDKIVEAVSLRLTEAGAADQVPSEKIQIMSFHSSKGLSAKIVFIPGLEEGIFPNQFAQHVPGLILENARLLYVAITRAKAACFLSYSKKRLLYGKSASTTPSRFCVATNSVFNPQTHAVLQPPDINTIMSSIADL